MNNNSTPSQIAQELRQIADEDIRNFRLPLKIEYYLCEVWTDLATQDAIVEQLLAGNLEEDRIPVGVHVRVMRDDSGRPAQLYFFHASFPNPIEVKLPLEKTMTTPFGRDTAGVFGLSGAMIQPLGMERSVHLN